MGDHADESDYADFEAASDAEWARFTAGLDAGQERIPEDWEIEGPAVSLSLGDAADIDPALLAIIAGPDGLGGQALGPAFGQGAPADALQPGPVLAALTVQAITRISDLSEDALTGVLQAGVRHGNWGTYIQTIAVAEFARRREAQFEEARARRVPLGRRPGEFPADELSVELIISGNQADRRIEHDRALTTRLPMTLAGMAAGLISGYRADIISAWTSSLSDADAAYADRILAPIAPGLRTDQLSRKAAALEMKLNPEGVKARKERAKQTRQRVEVRREDSGNASIAGRELDTADVIAAKAYVDAFAVRIRNSGLIEGSLSSIGARVLIELLQGRDPLTLIKPRPRIRRRTPDDAPRPSDRTPDRTPDGDGGGDHAHGDSARCDHKHGDNAGGHHAGGHHAGGHDAGGHDAGGHAHGDDDAAAGDRRGGQPPARGDGPEPGDACAFPDPDDPGPECPDDHGDPDGYGYDEPDDPDDGLHDPLPAYAGPDGAPAWTNDEAANARYGYDPNDIDGLPRRRGPLRPGETAPPPANLNLLIPIGTLLGWSTAPAQAGGFGLLDPDETRALVAAASRHPRTRWSVTLLDQSGRAIAHGRARGQHPWDPPPPNEAPPHETPPHETTPPSQPPGTSPPRADQLARLQEILRALNPRCETITDGTCDHRQAENRYVPTRKLRDLLRARNQTCDAPGCGVQAVDCDQDHTIPYPAGPTCQCNLGPKCRRHHRAKQAPGWKVEQPAPGTVRWTLPNGRTHTTYPSVYDT